jgi:hypothetical protein
MIEDPAQLAQLILRAMGRGRIRFRPPGVKPWTRFGTLGPVRSRLGLAWVIAPLVLGGLLLVAGWLLLR